MRSIKIEHDDNSKSYEVILKSVRLDIAFGRPDQTQ